MGLRVVQRGAELADDPEFRPGGFNLDPPTGEDRPETNVDPTAVRLTGSLSLSDRGAPLPVGPTPPEVELRG